ncbi:hypothetical protein MYAM1_003719 [Malassezia yamatoensis]|uniref:Zn(2)-C6 fungal-type domain-containing protein n=1 Tax=Malassezia yamatoensis TaxID=253288 RepID=A0AAJ6CI30_9BASI|nr:hypothetical protein MYAM1_003719 [Malassezia yamatoensis]
MDMTQAERPTKVRRMRKPVSCVECRIRKIKCDRNVPNCSACVRRGIRHHCRWGDERDKDLGVRSPAFEDFEEGMMWHGSSKSYHKAMSVFPQPIFEESKTMAALFQEHLEEWEQCMEGFLWLLPVPEEMDKLISFYFQQLEPLVGCMHQSVFLQEYNKLKDYLPMNLWPATQPQDSLENKQSYHSKQYAPFWANAENYGLLALVFAVLNATCDSMNRERDIIRLAWKDCATEDDFKQLLDSIHSASVTLLTESQCLERPTLWTLQAILLLQRRSYNKLLFSVNVVWNSLAIRLAQFMGISRLGSLQDDLKRLRNHTSVNEPPQAWVTGYMPWLREFAPNDLPKRELARKIWTTLVTADWLRSAHFDFSYMVLDETNHTAPPASLTDEELADVESLPDAVIQDTTRPSPQTFVRILLELASTVRNASHILTQKMVRQETLQLDYDQVREFDAQIGGIVQRIPIYYRFDGVSELTSSVQMLHAQYPYLALQRLLLQEMIHFRMLVLHAPYLQSAMRDCSQRRSLVACIEGACVVVTVWEEMQRVDKSNPQIHYIKWHLIVAAVVLDSIIACIHANGTVTSHTDYLRLKSSLRNAVSFLQDPQTKQTLRRLPKSMPLDHLQRFCDTPEPFTGNDTDENNSSTLLPSQPFVNDFAQLGDALPIDGFAHNPVNDSDLLANLDFLLTEGGISLSEPSLADTDFSFLAL